MGVSQPAQQQQQGLGGAQQQPQAGAQDDAELARLSSAVLANLSAARELRLAARHALPRPRGVSAAAETADVAALVTALSAPSVDIVRTKPTSAASAARIPSRNHHPPPAPLPHHHPPLAPPPATITRRPHSHPRPSPAPQVRVATTALANLSGTSGNRDKIATRHCAAQVRSTQCAVRSKQ